MKLLKPIDFQISQLISSTAVEAYANYSSGTTYSIGQRIIYSNRIYESLINSNTNNQPDTNPSKWLDFGPSNKTAMFDNKVSTKTTATTSLTVVVRPGAIFDTVALINSEAAVVKVTVRDGLGGTIVYENTAGMTGTESFSYYDYFFNDPLVKRTQVVFYGIPPFVNAHITFEFTNSSGSPVSCGVAVYGSVYSFGGTQYGASAGVIDYSVKETDEYGNITFVERPYSKRLNAEVWVNAFDLNGVQRTLYEVRAKPSVWIATDDPTYEEAAIVYGFYKSFDTVISYPSVSMLNLEIEGLS